MTAGPDSPPRCPECGFDWHAPAPRVLRAVRDAPAEYRRLLPRETLERPEVLRRRPAPAVWSALEYTAHTRDAVGWYEGRIRAVLAEPAARLEAFDWDAACEARRYRDEDPAAALDSVEAACGSLANLLDALDQQAWAKSGIGSSDGGPRSVLVLAQRAAHELRHHHMDTERSLQPPPSARLRDCGRC